MWAQPPTPSASATPTEASAPPAAQRHGLAVTPPRAEGLFAPLADGAREWLQAVLEGAGLEVVARSRVRSASKRVLTGERKALRGTDAPALAVECGAAWVLLSELHYRDRDGQAEVRLRVHDGSDGSVVAAALARGTAAELGLLLRSATARVLDPIGIPADGVAAEPPPSLAELGAYGRAVDGIEAAQLVRAWRELKGRPGRAADVLRSEIERVAASSSAGVPPSERSRLSSLRGAKDRDWLKVREALLAGRDPAMLLAGADSALARARPESAVELYGEAIGLDPRNRDAQLGLADVLAASGRQAEAVPNYRAAIELAPDDPGAYEKLGRNPELPPGERARLLTQAGDLRAERLESDLAQSDYREAAELDASVAASSYTRAAEVHGRVGNHGDALLAYEQAVSLDSGSAEALTGLGRTRRHLGDYAGAEQALVAALALRPNHRWALESLGTALVESDRAAEAIPHLEKAIALDPSDAASRHSLARAQRAVGNPEAALLTLDTDAEAVAPSDRVLLLEETAEIHASAGRLDEAELSLRTAIALEPEDPPLRTALAELYEASGDADAAEEQRALAASLGGDALSQGEGSPDSIASSESEGAGDDGKSIAVDFDGLIASFPNRDPYTRKLIGQVTLLRLVENLDWRQRVEDWLLPRTPDHRAIESLLVQGILGRFELAEAPPVPAELESAIEALRAFSTDPQKIALVNDMLGVDGTFLARLSRNPDGSAGLMSVEVRLLGGRSSEDTFVLANAALLPQAAGLTRWNWKALAPYGLLLALLSMPVIRGWGTLIVKLEYESMQGTKGFFNVKLSTKPEKARQEAKPKGGQSKERVFERKVRSWSRYARHMVGRESRFRMLPIRSYYVGVHGLLQDVATQDVIGNYVEEKKIQIKRGELSEVTFDFRRSEAPLEVFLQRPETYAQTEGEGQDQGRGEGQGKVGPGQVIVSLRGRPDTLRYVRGDSVLFYVGKGTHTVIVADGDRVFEADVHVDELQKLSISFALYEDHGLLFSGCPEAVEHYMHGDLTAAGEALAQSGQAEAANLILGEYHKQRGDKGKAAAHLQAAGRLAEAAELVDDEQYAGHSANLYSQAGDHQKAGERYEQAGEYLKAAEAYEIAYDYQGAIDAYQKAGCPEKVIELLERTGEYFEAGRVSLELEDEERAIRNLQLLDARDLEYGNACRMLAEIFARREEFELAAQKAEEAVTVFGEDSAPLEVHEQLGNLLESVGRFDAAIESFELIRKRDFQYPEVAGRIESLRARLSEQQAATEAARAASGGATKVAMRTQEDRYEILEEIGRGGMGVVYKARDRRLGRVVALKRLPENLKNHPTAVKLFLREARAAAALNHQNIVTLFDADQENDNYYITMELLEGLPFDAILKKRRQLSARDVARLGMQVAAGLQYAHEQRIVHRDIKTANLYFTRDKTVKIMDFGLAKMIEEVRRSTTVVGGTPYYMAPEQAAGESVDHRADLYAFGVTLFELLAGRVPFDQGDVLYHHRHSEPPDPRDLAKNLPDPMAELVLRMMAKLPEDRPQTTAEVRTLLTQLGQSLT